MRTPICILIILLNSIYITNALPAAAPYIPLAMSLTSYCNMNPHSCVRGIVNAYEHIKNTADSFEDRRRRVQQEEAQTRALQEKYNHFKQQHRNGKPFPGL